MTVGDFCSIEGDSGMEGRYAGIIKGDLGSDRGFL